MKTLIRKLLKRIIEEGSDIPSVNLSNSFGAIPATAKLSKEIDEAKILTAKSLINQMKSHGIYENIQDAEFKVFSQFGDDGIIQYLLHHLKIEPEIFIEFGVENYKESNTRFLLMNNNWNGLVIDGSKQHIEYIKNDAIYWQYDVTAVSAFIDKDNINGIFCDNKFIGDVGILSIDIDGNDYWVWKSINVIRPTLVIIEYNSLFGYKHAIAVPYDANFTRAKSHFSNQYWGCSLRALYLLAEDKGYNFVGSNSSGNNAYFVRAENMGKLKRLTVEEGYVASKFRDSRDEQGRLTYLSGGERIKIIEDMPVYEFDRGELTKIKDILNG